MSTDPKSFMIKGHEVKREPYHYRASGLDNVYLLNGFELSETKYGPTVTIHDVEGLHRAIATRLIEEQRPLSPREFRFLRKHMNLTQEDLAGRLGVDVQTVARYEKEQTAIPRPSDLVLRIMFCMFAASPDERQEIVEYIRGLLEDGMSDDVTATRQDFEFTPRGWNDGAHAH